MCPLRPGSLSAGTRSSKRSSAFSSSEQLPGAVVLPGEAGIGKTTLWLAGIEAATARGYRILLLATLGRRDPVLVRGAGRPPRRCGDVVAELPPIQRRALEAALLLGEAEIDADDRAVAAAFLEALRRLAARQVPSASRSTTSSGWTRRRVRRSATRSPAWIVSRLSPCWRSAATSRSGFAAPCPRTGSSTVEVAGLSLGATHELLHARLDATFPRPTLIRLWETSRGNPFFALELADALQRRGGTLAPGDELPIPTSLDELLHARIDSLGPAALEVARAVAALADPTVTLLEAALGASLRAGARRGARREDPRARRRRA